MRKTRKLSRAVKDSGSFCPASLLFSECGFSLTMQAGVLGATLFMLAEKGEDGKAINWTREHVSGRRHVEFKVHIETTIRNVK